MPNHEDTYPPTRYKVRTSKPTSLLTWRPNVLTYLTLVWIVLVLYQESYVFKSAIRSCKFESWTSPALPTEQKLALIGDPQLVDENTYSRRGLALWLTKFYTDLYMRRNYRLLHRQLAPELTVFTGDLFDGGREWSDDAWLNELSRYRGVFPTPAETIVADSLPGNHDIGISDGIKLAVYERFKKHFGETSKSIQVGGWEIVILDTVALSSPDEKVSKDARAFLNSYKKSKSEKPKMLITHVPLFRPADAYCGPLRETNSSIKIQRGFQYQNVLDVTTSDEIWQIVKPSIIFAGDDHDHCDYKHDNGIHEINVKSFSWAMGINYPGFQLVSLSGTRYETKLCLLPSQLTMLVRYAMLLFVTFTVLLYVRAKYGSGNARLLPVTSKDDAGKHRGSSLNKLQVWRAAWQDMARISCIMFVFYLYMIWW